MDSDEKKDLIKVYDEQGRERFHYARDVATINSNFFGIELPTLLQNSNVWSIVINLIP